VFLAELSWMEFKEKMGEIKVAVVPVASVEESGPYLPLGTDWLVAQELARRVAPREDVVVLPVIPFGYAPYHMDYPGTLSVEESAFRAYVLSICQSLIQWQMKRFVFINGHGGNRPILESISMELRKTHGAFGAIVQWWDLCSEIDPDWKTIGHGDAASISLMMNLRPDLVKTGTYDLSPLPLSKNMKPSFWTQTEFKGRKVDLFLKTSDFTAHGGFGFGKTKDRSEASPEKGEKILRATTDLIEGLIEELKSLQVS